MYTCKDNLTPMLYSGKRKKKEKKRKSPGKQSKKKNRYRLLPLDWISDEILLCSTVNCVWSLMMEHDNVRKNNVYMYA